MNTNGTIIKCAPTMEGVRNFLESSTIHGLAYIAKSGKYVRPFWTITVIAGFTCAGFLIYASFNDWRENPIKTTVDTRPITELTFPKVTVCPPKNTYTDLNYDLMMLENMTLDQEKRNELANTVNDILYDNYAQFMINERNIWESSNTSHEKGNEKLYDTFYNEVMRNLRKLEENDRYYNWYHGYTKIELPYYGYYGYHGHGVENYVYTGATSGSISTQHFGEKFNVDEVDRNFFYVIMFYPPDSVKNNPNITLHFNLEKISLRNISSESGENYDYDFDKPSRYEDDTREISSNLTKPLDFSYYMQLNRHVSLKDVRSQNLDKMPGFRVRWYYSGVNDEVQPEDTYSGRDETLAFVRYLSIY